MLFIYNDAGKQEGSYNMDMDKSGIGAEFNPPTQS